MSTYIKELSFIASLRSAHPSYSAALDFSKLTVESRTIPAGHSISETFSTTGTEEHNYLCATSLPRENLEFFFLCRCWNDGTQSYDIRPQHPMFKNNKSSLGSLWMKEASLSPGVATTKHWLMGSQSLSELSGWRVSLGDLPITSKDLVIGNIGPVKIIAPNGNSIAVYQRQNFGNNWWAYITCASINAPALPYGVVPVTITMNVKKIGMDDPFA